MPVRPSLFSAPSHPCWFARPPLTLSHPSPLFFFANGVLALILLSSFSQSCSTIFTSSTVSPINPVNYTLRGAVSHHLSPADISLLAQSIYSHPLLPNHLSYRSLQQTIMLSLKHPLRTTTALSSRFPPKGTRVPSLSSNTAPPQGFLTQNLKGL